ncbi:MAG: hypothetical protein K8R02_00930 [Anaerohalosphaeraceae bacterium]|nr:hypothetical protein [Anaerohalosphaeraceae bacterium]
MRFKALLYKEIREVLPWLLLAAAALLAFGFIFLQLSARSIEWHWQTFPVGNISAIQSSSDPDVTIWNMFYGPFIASAGTLLFLISIGLGIAIGVRQYWMGFFIKTWGFMLHRSASRGQILTAKLTAGAISFAPLAVIWALLYLYGHNRELFPVPPATRTFIEGLIFIGLGYVVYLAIAIARLSPEKWYTRIILGPALGIWVFFALVMQWQITLACGVLIIAAAILLVQITNVFLTREFE